MAALAVVEDLEIGKDCVRQLDACLPSSAVEYLGLPPAPERFNYGDVFPVNESGWF
jgi:hypothetical protein